VKYLSEGVCAPQAFLDRAEPSPCHYSINPLHETKLHTTRSTFCPEQACEPCFGQHRVGEYNSGCNGGKKKKKWLKERDTRDLRSLRCSRVQCRKMKCNKMLFHRIIQKTGEMGQHQESWEGQHTTGG